MTDEKRGTAASAAFLLVALLGVAANLRPALTSVGPLIDLIRQDLGLSATAAGLLNSLPLFAFAVFSPLAHFANRIGIERTLAAAMLVLIAGILYRSLGGVAGLFVGTLVLGASIAVGNVLLPGVIKRDFPHRVGGITTAYAIMLALTAAIASGVSVPLARLLPGGWQSALAFWALPAALALFPLAWLLRAGNDAEDTSKVYAGATPIWRSLLAWQVTLFMGLQSFSYYVAVSWLPSVLQDMGYTAGAAGWIITLFQIVALAATLAMPSLIRRGRDQRLLAVATPMLLVVAILGLIAAPGAALFWIVLAGIGNGPTMILALTFFGLRTNDHRQAAALSLMAQSIGYFIAALGPIIFGLLHDVSHGWTVPLLALAASLVIQAAAGFGAGRDTRVGMTS
ncbi:MAG TPA: MFS transporter [Xanthobacteraceae bacterium]|jgi:CP family cyanate transporter-like MFS transporter|nr:MFS transporter [Xanthobacteraceae bacterium]